MYLVLFVFFFKQKTAYEMRISDWSSDVCSSDLLIPEWGGAQREYLAVAATGDVALTRAARERMRLLGMPDGVISSVARNGSPRSTITITAPSSGAVTILNVRPGMSVSTGQTLAEITGLNPIWLEAAVPEILAGDVREIGRAHVCTPVTNAQLVC